MRVAFFIVLMCFALYKMRDDAIWAVAMGVFVYFAIPSREFYMPTLPYQALFFGSAILLSIRTRDLFNDWAKREIRGETQRAASAVYEAIRAPVAEIVARAALDRRPDAAAREEAMRLATERFEELKLTLVPAKLEAVVRSVLVSRLEAGLGAGLREAARMLGIHGGAPPRNFLPTMTERVLSAIDAAAGEGLEQDLDKQLALADSAHERAMRMQYSGDTGFLGIPLPSGGVVAILTNVGFWLHLAFTVATAYTAQTARYSVELASGQVQVCVLLLIPLCAIMVGVRTAEQLRVFLWSWIAGVLVLCYNGITLWLAHGGRADNVGGQANDANWLGIIAVSVAPIGFSMITGERNPLVRLGGLGVAGICALGIIACGSRGALIALVLGVAYWFVWTNKKGIALAILLTGGAAFLAVAPDEFWERMGSMFLKESNPWVIAKHESSAESRKRFWALARELFAEKPWTGIGPLNYPKEVAVRGIMIEFGEGPREMACHSTWFHLLAEYGVWGTIWMIAHLVSFGMIFRAMILTRRLKEDPQYHWLSSYMVGVQAGWIGGWLAMSFVSSQWYDFNFWIFVVGPTALKVAEHTLAYKDWFKRPLPSTELPPARYGPPSAGGLDLGRIDVSSQPVLRAR